MGVKTVPILPAGVSAAPLSYTIPGSLIAELLSVAATFDGSGAGSDFKPCVDILSPNGDLIARCPASSVTAGQSAEVSFFPLAPAASAAPASSGDFVKIGSVTVGVAGAATIAFSGIPGTYSSLKLVGSTRTDEVLAFSNVLMLFNGDGGHNYAWQETYAQKLTSYQNWAEGFAGIRVALTTGAGAPANTFGGFEVTIPNYASSHNYTAAFTESTGRHAANFDYIYNSGGVWLDTSAVTSVTLYVETGGTNFVQYSTVTLYGLK